MASRFLLLLLFTVQTLVAAAQGGGVRGRVTDIATKVEGVVAVDVDAESQLDLVRRLNIMRTPTVLVLDKAGVVVQRASGLPRRENVITALGEAIPNSAF